MSPTPAQLAILRARFPGIGEPTLLRNASLLLSRPHLQTLPPTPPAARQTPVKPTQSPKAKKPRVGRVPRTRNAGTWTEAEYWQRIRSCLRKMSQWWRPARAALNAARVACRGPRGQKWAYICADCGPTKLHPRKRVHIDHIEPCGALTDYDHIGEFIRRLTPENPRAYAVRCLDHHQSKTNSERR